MKKTFEFTTWKEVVYKGSISVEAETEEEAIALLQDHTEISGDPMDVIVEDTTDRKMKSSSVTIYNDDDDVIVEWGDI